MSTLYINNKHIDDLGARLLDGYTVGGTEVSNEYFHGKNRTSFNLLSQERGLKEIEFELEFEGTTRREIMLHKSKLDASMMGDKVDLYFPDDMHYLVMMTSFGEMTIEGVNGRYVVGKATYKAEGICHDDMVTHTGNTIWCDSTALRTDCILECTTSKKYPTLTIGTVTLTDIAKGKKIKIDGIDGRILIDGGPVAGNFTLTGFPYLTPDWNTFDCDETLTISYYPTYA